MFIDTTDKTIKIVMKTEQHQNFKNHSQQIILYSYIQSFGFIALTPVSNTVLHRFPSPLRNALCSSAVAISIYSVVHTRLPLYATHCLALIILSKSCRSLAYIGFIAFLEPFTLFQAALDIPKMLSFSL
jgi:hypothetical protein